MGLPGMGWLSDLLGWDEEDLGATPPQDIEAMRAQQYARQWRQAVAPSTATAGPQPQSDPLQTALQQWQNGGQGPITSGGNRPVLPMQGPLRPGETRPMRPVVGPPIAPPAAPVDQPAANPWLAAVDAWRQGPPQQPAYNPLSSANTGQAPKPTTDISSLITYDVKPTLPQIGTGYDQPNTGVGQFSAQQTQAPTVGSQIKPMQGPQPYNPSDWLSRQIGNWQKPIGEAADTAGGFINDYARNVGEIGPLDATRELFAGTAGYDKAMANYATRQKNAQSGYIDETPGWNGALDNPIVGSLLNNPVTDTILTGLDVFSVPQKAIEQLEIPGSGNWLGGNKENVTVGQASGAVGQALNQTLNPFWDENPLKMSYWDLAKDTFDGGLENWFVGGPNVARDIIFNSLSASQQVNETIKNLPADLRTQANIALVNQISGPERLQSTIDTILNKDELISGMEQAAQIALQNAQEFEAIDETQKAKDYRLMAAQFGARADELRKKSAGDIVDDYANPWAELIGGILFDPTNLIGLGGGQEAIQAAKSVSLMNLTPDQAIKALDGVLDNATKAAVGGDVTGWWAYANPFGRGFAKDSQASLSTDTLWRAASNIMADVTNKEQAKAVLDVWTNDPRQLVEGVVLPGSTEISKWGPGVVANSELLKQYPILVKSRDALLNMASLTGDPATFSPREFFAELNEVLYKQSREAMGMTPALPGGAVDFRVVRAPDGTSLIEYVDKTGKVIKKSEAMLPVEAAKEAAQLKKAAAGAKPGGGQNPLAATWGLQKAILSDMYLGMSPGYWIKNATSAAATMLTDNTMTLLPTNAIMNDFMTKFGGILPTTRSAEAASNALGQAAGEALGGMHWSEKLFGKDNPYAKMMNKLYSIPFGATDIAGRVPFGEQNFALRATYVPFKRYLTSQWGDAAKGFEQTLTTLGIDPNLAKSLANTVADVGVNGNKAQMQQVMKKLTTAQVVPFSLKELGVPDELVSAEGWAKLNTVLSESLPNQLEEAAAKVSEIFGQEFKAAGQLLNSAPPQPGRYVWTEFESVQDGADVVDSMVDAAKRAGLPADQMRQEAQGLMKQISETEAALWTTLRQDLAGATDSSSLNVAMDLMAKWYDWRTTARAQVDALSKQAIQANTADAWAKKFEGTRQIYGGFTDFFQKATDEARQNLMKLEQGGQVEGGYDWWNVIKRYASYDEAEVRTARTAGMGVGSPQGQGDVFTKALDANRKYVDKSVVELFSAFRQYPSQTTLDLMADGMRKMEELGAKAAGFLAEKRTEMLPKNADAYYKLRNQVWAEFFDNSVVHNNVVKRLVVASGVADMAKGALKWSDEFSGGEFQLVGKMADNFWQARNTATGELVRFADPVALQQAKNANQIVVSSLPTVPLNTVQDFYRVIGENTNIVDKLIEELNTTAAAAGGLVQTPGVTDFGAGIGQAFGKIIDALAGGRSNNPYTVAPTASGWNPWGIAEAAKQTDLYKLVSGINGNLGDLLGKKAPEVGEMAQHTIRTLTDAERKIIQRLPEILAGKQNTMTPAQQLRVLDALNDMMPQYDNVLAGAVRTGEQMANYAMLNYNDKRNIDVWAAALMPYHYFWSRSAKNWMERAIQKPGVVNMYYESQRAIEMENEQNNVPEHLRGTIQNPLKQVMGVGPDRLLNPLQFMLPFAMYLGSDFVNPDEGRSELEKWMMTIKKYTPTMYPIADYATKAMLDQTAPLPGGKRRTDEFQLGDVLPLYKMAGYGYQAATGDMSMSQGPLGYGDEYDYGRAGKQVALAGLRGDVSPQDAMWGSDVGYQQQTGAQPLPEQQGQGTEAWQQGAQAAGWDRFMNRAGAFLTGVPGYNLSPEEQQMRDMKAERVKLGYNEVSNPYGSKEAVNAYTNMQPEQFDATFNYAVLYPSSDTTKRQRPGEGAVQTEYYNQHGVIMNDMTQAVAKFLVDNPNATSKELNDFKAPYWDKVEELKAKYPSLPAKEVKHLNTKYMNPVEHAAGFVQSILSHKPAGQPTYPGKDATAEEKKKYYLDKAKWDIARLDYYDRQFTQLLNQDDTYPDPWKEAARKMVKDMYSSELLRGYENRYAGDVEKAWSDRQSFVEEVGDAERVLNTKNVVDRVGQQGSELLSQYYALPKGSEERKQFKQENPLVQAAIMASFQPQEYDEFVKRFGPDAFAMVSGGPKHPGDGATEAQLQQYYAAADAYAQQYPNAEAAKLWLNGRRYGAAEGEDSYGAAYDEALKTFPGIFDILNSVPQGKDAYVAWLKANPEEYMLYTGYREWKNEYKEEDKATQGQQTTPEEEAIIPNANAGQGYTGPRPVGSERQALGTFDPYAGYGPAEGPIDVNALGWKSQAQPEQPNQWANRNWDNLLNQPADNAWTQRANELNAGILGGEAIPSQMSATGSTRKGPPTQPTFSPLPGPQPQAAATGSADLKTARDYASMNDKWVKGEMTRQEWAARRGSVNGYFGAGGAKMFDEYYNLPKGPQREEYLKKNPVMRAINLYAYNSKELQPALKMFGDDALGKWALTPAYADTPEAKAARNAYYDKNPVAFEFGAWLTGRPANRKEGETEGAEGFKYNFGADHAQAKELFGENIWEVVSQFKRSWNGTQKRMWYEKHPEYLAWQSWWYGSEQREYKGGGMGGYAPFGGYNKAERKTQVRIQDVYGQGMSGGLGEPARVAGYQNPSMDWMRQGQELKPGRQVKEWSPEWIRGIKK